VSVVAIDGQEDDDFAYEDEHIELESENQEYKDLADSEFGSLPRLVKPEARFRVSPTTSDPPSRLPPRIPDAASTVQLPAPSQTIRPPTRQSRGASPTSNLPKAKPRTKSATHRVKGTKKAKKKVQPALKSAGQLQAKKRKPAQKKSGAKTVKRTAAKSSKNNVSTRKKAAKKGGKAMKRSGGARTKRRKA